MSATYGADRAIARPEFDRFGRAGFAQGVASMLSDHHERDGVVIGIYGTWGDGKTSVMNLVRYYLRNTEGLRWVPFNPWLIRSAEQLLPALMETVADAVGSNLLSPGRRIAKAVSAYGDAIAPLDSRIAAASGGLKAVSTLTVDRQRDRVGQLLSDKGLRLVIAIDDIDRLEADEAKAVLKLVKLTAQFPYVSYLLAFDERAVATAIGQSIGGGVRDGQRYVEKIVQVPMHLPAPEVGALERFTLELIQTAFRSSGIELTSAEEHEVGQTFTLDISGLIQTPRTAVRYANAVRFAAGLLKHELNLVDLLKLEAIRVSHPDLFQLLPGAGQLLLGTYFIAPRKDQLEADARQLLTNSGIGVASDQDRHVTALLKSLFPFFAEALAGRASERWDPGRYESDQRVASPRYFERYLTYHVPGREIPDVEIESFLARATDMRSTEAALQEFMDSGRAESIVGAIRRRASQLDSERAEVLAQTLSRIGNRLPRPEISFDFQAPYVQGAIAVRQLLEQVVDPTARDLVGHECIGRAGDVPYAATLASWIDTDEDPILTPGGHRRVAAELVQRIANDAVLGSPLYLRYARDATLIFSLWAKYGSRVTTEAYLAPTFEAAKENVLAFIANYAPYSYSAGSRVLGNIDMGQFQAIASVIDPGIVAKAVGEALGTPAVSKEFPRAYAAATPTDLGMQFLYLFESARAGDT